MIVGLRGICGVPCVIGICPRKTEETPDNCKDGIEEKIGRGLLFIMLISSK